MKRILFPTDFSTISLNAFEFALDLADNQNADLVILHTYDSINLNSGQITPKMFDNFRQHMDLKELQGFKKVAPKFHEIANKNNLNHIKMEFVLEMGDLVSTIKEKIKSEQIDLVIMGSSSNEDENSAVLGTDTHQVILQTNIPVLCIPPKATFKDIKTVAFSTVFSPIEKKSFEFMLNLAFKKQIKIKCIYVDNRGDKYIPLYEDWKQTFTDDFLEFVILKEKSAVKAVSNYIIENNIDMIATVKRNEAFFTSLLNPSFTKALAKNVNIPLLAFK